MGAGSRVVASCAVRRRREGRSVRAALGSGQSREGGGPSTRGRRKEREREREKKREKENGKKEKKKREGKGGIRADAMRPRPATRDGRVRSAGFAAWSTAGRPRVRRAEGRMGQRVIGTEK